MSSAQRNNFQMEILASTDDTISKVEEEFLERLDKALDLQKATSNFKEENVGLETDKSVRRSMPGLPTEVWVMILGFLPDKKHLRAAVHSCRYLLTLWYVAAPSRVPRPCLLFGPLPCC